MNYDFDVLSIVAEDFKIRYAGILSHFGMTEQARRHFALFRDSEVIEALAGASPEVRDCFVNSGFGMTGYDSGAGVGRFREADTALRELTLAQLRRNVERLSGNLRWNGFDIDAFFDAAEAAVPTRKVDSRFAVSFLPVRPTPCAVARVTSRALSVPA